MVGNFTGESLDGLSPPSAWDGDCVDPSICISVCFDGDKGCRGIRDDLGGSLSRGISKVDFRVDGCSMNFGF